MTIYEILFVDGSSYILAADGIDNGDYSIRFFQKSKLVARFKRCEVRGWIVRGEMNND